MDSSKRLAGLMTMSASKPEDPSVGAAMKGTRSDIKADTSDAGFFKIDPTTAMANTATNFGAGIDKEAVAGDIMEEKQLNHK